MCPTTVTLQARLKSEALMSSKNEYSPCHNTYSVMSDTSTPDIPKGDIAVC